MNVYFKWNELNPHTWYTMCVCMVCVSFLMYNLFIHICVLRSSVCLFGTTFLCFSFHKHEIYRIQLAVTRWAFRVYVCMCVRAFFLLFSFFQFIQFNGCWLFCMYTFIYALSHNIRYNIFMKNQFDGKTTTTTTSTKFQIQSKNTRKN